MIDTAWLTVPCGACGAAAGEFCGGDCKPGDSVHGSRVMAYDRLTAARAAPPSPGLVEAARKLSMELEDWFGMDCESAPPAVTETFNVLRAALDKEPK